MKTPLEDDHELDRLFRDKLAGEEAAPPAFVWNEVERKLHPPRRRPAAWKWWLSGALLLLLSAGGWWWMHVPSSAPHENSAPQLLASSENKSSANDAKENAPSLPVDSSSQNPATVETQNVNAITPGVSSAENSQDVSREKSAVTNEHSQKAKIVSHEGNVVRNADAPKNNAHVFANGISQPKNSSRSQDNTNVVTAPGSTGNSDSKTKEPVAAASTSNEPEKSSANVLTPGETPAAKESNGSPVATKEQAQTTAMQNEPASSSGNEIKSAGEQKIRPVLPSDTSKVHPEPSPQVKLVVADTTKKDSSRLTPLQPAVENQPAKGMPFYFVGVHASLDNQKIASKEGEVSHSSTDIDLYSGDSAPLEINSSTTSYGGRAGYFVTQHFAVIAGGNYSVLEVHSPGRFFKYNHNDDYTFTFHSATAAVQLPSSAFTYLDNNGPPSDTFIVHVTSVEKYAYLHFQLGGAWYPVRKRYFGIYVNALSNGALLQHQQLTLTSVRTGKTFEFSGDGMSGMKKLTFGAQFGAGFEFTPVRNLGIWIEPAYFVSGAINPENAFVIRPSAMRFQAGLLFHF